MRLYTVLLMHLMLYWVFGNEAMIEKVQTFASPARTSVVIYYSGTERLRFFALDSTDRILTLDLPGVFSNVDFSQLKFAQLDSVLQGPLDPDVSNGISLRFYLKENAEYEIYENRLGELTLLFETIEPALDVEPLVEQIPASEPVVHQELVQASPAVQGLVPEPDPEFEMEKGVLRLSGPKGARRFYQLDVNTTRRGGSLQLFIENFAKYRTFFLENPRRYVVDLKNTVLSLDQSDLELSHPLIKHCRVRQFQARPLPITRLVLEVSKDAHLNVTPVDDGIRITFADDVRLLDGASKELVSTSDNLTAGPSLAQEGGIPEEEPEEVALVAFFEEIRQGMAQISVPSRGTLLKSESEGSIRVLEPRALPTERVEVTAEAIPLPHRLEPLFADKPMAAEVRGAEVDGSESPTVAGVVASADSNLTLFANEEPKPLKVALSVAERPNIPTGTEAPQAFGEPEVGAVEVAKAVDPETAKRGHDVVEEPVLPPMRSEETLSPSLSSAELHARGSLARGRPLLAETRPLLTEPISNASPTVAEKKPTRGVSPFVMASELDLEMEKFLKEEKKPKTFYNLMKSVKSNRPAKKPIVVTNTAIEKSKNLTEMRPMQDLGVPESLFEDQEVSDDFAYDTIDSGEVEYKGFEISIIDVKDANVVDLLRFIADQVGINLYVDSSVGDLKATYRFRNIPWDHALDIILTNANLDKEFRNGVLRVATTEKFRQEEMARAQLEAQRELSVPPETVTFPLNYAKAEEVVPIITEYLSGRGTILMDERTNTLIIEDIPKKMVAIRALVKKLDKMIAQVTIEARVVETTKRFLKELGVQWGLGAKYSPELGTNTGLDFPHRINVGGPLLGTSTLNGLQGGYAVNFPVVDENPSGFGLSLGNFLDNFKLDISLQMLESEGFGQIISAPKITTQNNKTAVIKNGQRIPIQTIQRGTLTIRYIDAVLELRVTPHITADETIIMEIVVDKSEPDFTRTVSGNPVINIRRAETKLLVKNGGTAVIGGIFSLNEQNSERGIPKLRKTPFIKHMFGSELKNYENQELLIFVTPRIIKY